MTLLKYLGMVWIALCLFLVFAGCGNITPLPDVDDSSSTPDATKPSDSSTTKPDAGTIPPQPDASIAPPSTFPTCPNAVNSGYVDCNVRAKGYECVKAGPWEDNTSGCIFTEPGVLPLKVTVNDCSACQTL